MYPARWCPGRIRMGAVENCYSNVRLRVLTGVTTDAELRVGVFVSVFVCEDFEGYVALKK